MVISQAHALRAIQIVESWRESLHRLWANELDVEVVSLGNRIIARIERTPAGHSQRDLCQQLHQPARAVGEALELLEKAGRIESIQIGRQVRWRATSVATVANCSTADATEVTHPNALQANCSNCSVEDEIWRIS